MILNNGIARGINPLTTFISLFIIFIFIILTLNSPDNAARIIDNTRTFITVSLGYWYIWLSAFFLTFCIILAISPYGKIKLGKANDKPTFNYFTWFAMIYAAGQGIGIIFWSIAEPMFHFSSGTPFLFDDVNNQKAAIEAMTVAYFHWGLNAWAIYCIVALTMAFVCFRLNKPLSVRYTLYPLLGERVNGMIGIIIDIVAIFATLFGIATSLGLGVQQINSGLNTILNLPNNIKVQIALIITISLCALISVMSGLHKGIKYLSIANMCLTIVMLLFFIFLGPTIYLFKLFNIAILEYIKELFSMNVYIEKPSIEINQNDLSWKSLWQGWWTIFYWGWWISWAPFVGVFVARVSKGRTIREFVLGFVGVSSILSFVWLVAYGGTALNIDLNNVTQVVSESVKNNVSEALYVTIDNMNLGTIGFIASVISTLLVVTYFITSSDSGTLVLTMILSEGNQNPLIRHRVFWGVLQGIVAAILLFAGGNAALSTLQTASITAALPFSILMIFMCISLIKGIHGEYINQL